MVFTGVLGVAVFFGMARQTMASDGIVELTSTMGKNYRCFVVSLGMQNLEYRIPFACRDLLYPAGENIFTYVMWATPIEGDAPIKLGSLGLGKGEFKTKTPFSNLFVTTEKKSKTKIPTGVVVMRGAVEPIAFLERPPVPTSTQSPEKESIDKVFDDRETDESEGADETTTEFKGLSTKEKLFSALKRAGTAALIALVAVVGVIFVISKKRR